VETSNYSYDIGCETWDLPSFNMNLSKSWVDPDFKQNSNHPVVCISWHDAQAYVSWLSAVTGEQYRLLSESEWEYVARAGSSSKYSFGDKIDSTKANYGNEFRGTTAVGSYAGNKFGLHDIHGNASEWVNDCWVDSYEYGPNTGASMTGGSCKRRIFRGGTWSNSADHLRSAYRYGYFPDFKLSGIGFRVVKVL
jgi:formylglycine-generating enzyme required for sulfatase activity